MTLSKFPFACHPASFFSPALLSEGKGVVWQFITRLARAARVQIQTFVMLLFVQNPVLAETFTGEYFLESDPGVSQGVAFTTDATGNLDLTIPTDALSFGLHRTKHS